MAGSAKNISVKFAVLHTAVVTDGDFSTATGANATLLGTLGSGSTLVQPNVLYEKYSAGMMDVGGDLAMTLILLGTGSGWLSTVKGYNDANPKTEIYIFLLNKSLTKYWQYFCVPGKPIELTPENEPNRQSVALPFFCDGDDVDDFLTSYEFAVTMPG